MQEMISTRKAYGEALLELARANDRVVAVAADTSKSMFTSVLDKDFPHRHYDVGIAEQNMMMIAAGLASTGKIVFASTYALFSSMRTCEQVRTFIAYPKLNVKIVSGLGGLSAGIEGVTHTAAEDVALVRAIPNMVIILPSDAASTKKAIKAVAEYEGPSYVRLGRDESPVLFDDSYQFEIGKGILHRDEGDEVALVASGLILSEVLQAAQLMAQSGIKCKVVEIHTIKPIDRDLIVQVAQRCNEMFTIEEHSVIGGLGSAVAEVLCEEYPRKFNKIALPDAFLETGTPYELADKYGLTAEKIARLITKKMRQ